MDEFHDWVISYMKNLDVFKKEIVSIKEEDEEIILHKRIKNVEVQELVLQYALFMKTPQIYLSKNYSKIWCILWSAR